MYVRPAHVPQPVELEEEPQAPSPHEIPRRSQGHLGPRHELILSGVATQLEALRAGAAIVADVRGVLGGVEVGQALVEVGQGRPEHAQAATETMVAPYP